MPTSVGFRELVAAAVAAPSSHNTQPWLFEELDRGIAVLADRTRALPVNDPFDRELTISCGTALFNIEVCAHRHGLQPTVTVLPDPNNADVLAHVVLDHRTQATDLGDLYDTIEHRRTTRDPFDPDALPDGLIDRLQAAAHQHAVHFDLVSEDNRAALSALVAEGDRMQFSNPHWRRELASWMHPRRKGDGLVVPEITGLVSRAVVSAVNVGRSVAGQDETLATDAPIVAVLSTDRDDPASWLEAGRALEHVLLTAADHGAVAGYLNQPCQVAELRPQLAQLLPTPRHPQVVIRLGRLANTPPGSPRRAIDDVIVHDERV